MVSNQKTDIHKENKYTTWRLAMSNIVCEPNKLFLAVYKSTLQKKIDIVCKKIDFDDSLIQWNIYEPETHNNTAIGILVGIKGSNYGFCDPYQNKIWISTLSIQKELKTNKLFSNILCLHKKQNDFLAEVIIDEITHIQTKANHGDSDYARLYEQNVCRYYSTLGCKRI